MIVAAHQTMMGPPALPYDAEVEYLSSDGSQYVDTGVAPNLPCALTYKAGVSFPNTTTRKIMGLQGGMYFGVVNGKYQAAQGGTASTGATVSPNVFYDFGITFNKTDTNFSHTTPASRIDWSLDNMSGTANEAVYYFLPSTATIWLFVANDATTLRGASSIKYFQIERNGVLLRDFIPVRVGSVGYLFDRVSGTIFGNAGTGAFTIGPDKT